MNADTRPRIATVSLAGCFGCHMSILDIDERLFDLVDLVQFDRSPLTDIKSLGDCDIGLIEGGVCNAENVHVLREFRDRCAILVAVGACAINGGLPAQRNRLPLATVLNKVYREQTGLARRGDSAVVPDDPELPLLLEQVKPLHEIVQIDYFLPGCPPPAEAIWGFLTDLLSGRDPHIDRNFLRYD
jgi:NAD-reducing hydrogenase small subunit